MIARQKKQQDFLRLYEPVHDQFERFCRARVYGDMEYTDLMNETLLVAYQKFDSLRSDQAFLSFLFGICVRLLSNRYKKKKEEVRDTSTLAEIVPDQQSRTDRDAEVYLLHRALVLLVEEQRECVILYEISGLKIKEIAAIQQVSEAAVKQRLKRGRKKLTEILTFESVHKTGGVPHE